MTAKHWLLTFYVLLVTTIALFAEQKARHPKTALQFAMEREQATHDSAQQADKRAQEAAQEVAKLAQLDQYCAQDFALARDRRDTVEVVRGHGAIFASRDGRCYIDANGTARWRP